MGIYNLTKLLTALALIVTLQCISFFNMVIVSQADRPDTTLEYQICNGQRSGGSFIQDVGTLQLL